MAEEEVDERLEEDDVENEDGEDGESNGEKKRLSKATIIKIAIGLVILLGAGAGGYFFFAPKEIPPEELPEGSTAVEGVEEDTSNKDMTPEESALKMIEMREASLTLREENLRLKQQLIDLEDPNNEPEEEMLEDGEEVEETKEVKEMKKEVPADTSKSDSSITRYEFEPDEYSLMRGGPKREPAPKPKWGDFDRFNNK